MSEIEQEIAAPFKAIGAMLEGAALAQAAVAGSFMAAMVSAMNERAQAAGQGVVRGWSDDDNRGD